MSATPPSETVATSVDLYCPHCGYNLRGIDSAVCPECGKPFDRAALNISQIPWVHRKEIGIWRAFWRTVWMTTFHPRQLALDMSVPARLEDALSFRRNVVASAGLPLMAAIAVIYVDFIANASSRWGPMFDWQLGMRWPYIMCWMIEFFVILMFGVTLWIALYSASGVASWFFRPAEMPVRQQNRAVSLSYYTCAPLAWSFIPTITGTILWTSDLSSIRFVTDDLALELVLGGASIVFSFVQLSAWWGTVVILRKHAIHCGWLQAWIMGFVSVAISLVSIGVIVGGLTAAAAAVAVVIFSLI